MCSENNGSGIYVVGASNWTVTENHCLDNNFDYNGNPSNTPPGTGTGNGITVARATHIVIENNEFSDTEVAGPS